VTLRDSYLDFLQASSTFPDFSWLGPLLVKLPQASYLLDSLDFFFGLPPSLSTFQFARFAWSTWFPGIVLSKHYHD
jgi:hypothetical protein